jgi:hypothetical protein
VEALYERVAMGWKAHECYVSAEALQALADLAGLALRDIIRRLPDPGLNKVAARARARAGSSLSPMQLGMAAK